MGLEAVRGQSPSRTEGGEGPGWQGAMSENSGAI